VDEFQYPGLFGHSLGDFRNTVSDQVNGRGSCKVEILLALAIPDVDALASDCRRKLLPKGSP